MSPTYCRTLFLLLIACGISLAQNAVEPADIILVNGRVFTATEAHPYAEAIAIKGERIEAVGTNQAISAMAGPNTRRFDLAGHVVIPGLDDVHTHFGADFQGTMLDFGGLEPQCSASAWLPRWALVRLLASAA